MEKDYPVQMLWVNGPMSKMERACVSSFLKKGHAVHVYTYDKASLSNLPEGTLLMDAEEILPSSRIFKYKDHNSYAGFSNLFRYKILYHRGGWWVDTDVYCLKRLDFSEDFVFAQQRNRPGEEYSLNNNVIKAPPGSKLIHVALETAEKADVNKMKWGDMGPTLFTRLVHSYGMNDFVKEANVFNPIDWCGWEAVLERGVVSKSVLANSYTIHFWNEMWRREQLDKDGDYSSETIYGSLVSSKGF